MDTVDIVTRHFDDPGLGARFAAPCEDLAPGCRIRRRASARSAYLEKDALAAELPSL